MSARAEVPPLSLAVAYFGSALFFLACGAAGLVWIAPDLASGAFPLRSAVAVTHLFTLGWITLSMLGALHHFVPVALHVRLMPLRCAWVQLALFAPGLAAFAAGEFLGVRPLALAGAGALGLALVAFALRLGLALVGVGASRTARALLVAAAFLVVTATFGVLLAGDPALGWLGRGRAALAALHIHVALVGWVLLVVVAVAQRLLPMFLLARAPDTRLGALSLLLVGAGAAAMLAFNASGVLLRVWVPLALVAAGLALFLVQSGKVYAQSRGELDPGMRFAGVGLVFLGVALVIAPFALRMGPADPQRLVLYVGAAVLASIAIFVCGHYYRIVPFLVWSRRYAQRPPVPGVAGPGALYRADVAIMALLCFVTGATTFLVSVAHGTRNVAQAGAVAFALGAALLVVQISGVLYRGRAG